MFRDSEEILKKYKSSQLPYMRVMNGEQFNVSLPRFENLEI
jgi:hypothetical protein